MGRLVYTAQCSLDGFTEDRDGSFGFTVPSEEAHVYINDRERPVSTYVFGRRMFETMRVWDTDEVFELFDEPIKSIMGDFAQTYRAADKLVYSRTLTSVDAPKTSLLGEFDADRLREIVAAAPGLVSIGGPEIAAFALRAGLVQQLNLLIAPIVLGAGTSALPADVAMELELTDQRSFSNGMLALTYAVL